MHLKEISLSNFKNYAEAKIQFDPQINCLLGNNGQGKTNLLDAIHYLSFCKSYFSHSDIPNIKLEEDFFSIEGVFSLNDADERIFCGFKKGPKKIFRRNKKEYERLADHIGLIPLVMITPLDSELIYGESEIRRKLLNAVISQYNKKYLNELIGYNKTLVQRNNLLKQFGERGGFDKNLLDVYSIKLNEFGLSIFQERKKFLNDYIEIFEGYYKKISKGVETVNIEYISHYETESSEPLYEHSLEKDRALGYTTKGIHRDDLNFLITGLNLKKFASQGQQKTFLIALKLAEYEFLCGTTKQKPILLLDDVYDKLDDNRVSDLMELISSDRFGQIFLTDTNKFRVPGILKNKARDFLCFEVDNGKIQKILNMGQ